MINTTNLSVEPGQAHALPQAHRGYPRTYRPDVNARIARFQG